MLLNRQSSTCRRPQFSHLTRSVFLPLIRRLPKEKKNPRRKERIAGLRLFPILSRFSVFLSSCCTRSFAFFYATSPTTSQKRKWEPALCILRALYSFCSLSLSVKFFVLNIHLTPIYNIFIATRLFCSFFFNFAWPFFRCIFLLFFLTAFYGFSADFATFCCWSLCVNYSIAFLSATWFWCFLLQFLCCFHFWVHVWGLFGSLSLFIWLDWEMKGVLGKRGGGFTCLEVKCIFLFTSVVIAFVLIVKAWLMMKIAVIKKYQ